MHERWTSKQQEKREIEMGKAMLDYLDARKASVASEKAFQEMSKNFSTLRSVLNLLGQGSITDAANELEDLQPFPSSSEITIMLHEHFDRFRATIAAREHLKRLGVTNMEWL